MIDKSRTLTEDKAKVHLYEFACSDIVEEMFKILDELGQSFYETFSIINGQVFERYKINEFSLTRKVFVYFSRGRTRKNRLQIAE